MSSLDRCLLSPAESRQLDKLVIKIVADLMGCHMGFVVTPDLFMKQMRFAGNPEFVAELDRCGDALRSVESKLLVNHAENFADNLNRFKKILLDIKKIADDFDKTFGMKMRVSEEFIPKLVRLIESMSKAADLSPG
jgi:hypothetical protein